MRGLTALARRAERLAKSMQGARKASLDLISDKQSKRIEEFIDGSVLGPYLKAYLVDVLDNPNNPDLAQAEQFFRDYGIKLDFMAIRRVAREAKRLGWKPGQKNGLTTGTGGALRDDFDTLVDLGGI